MKVRDKVFVVTGGGNGIGRELVLQLLSMGASVAAIDINKDALDETYKLSKDNNNLTTHVVNITDRKAVEVLPNEVISKHGVVDGIINNAGIIQPFVKVNDLDYEKINFVMDVNFYGTLYMVKSFLPHLLLRPEAHVINVSSMGGFLPVPGQGIYGASKAAVKLLTEALHSELKDTNVRVTVVFPGGVSTNITKNSNVEHVSKTESKSYKLLTADKCAHIIIKGIEKNRFRVVAGRDAKMMDFFYRLNPKRATKLIAKMMSKII